MRERWATTILAGTLGGAVVNVAMLLTFRLLGFGWQGGGILLDPARQSPKLIAVWTELQPLPLVVSLPELFALGLMLFGFVHAVVYGWLAPAWPPGIVARAWRFALLVFFLSYAFFEFFTPFNLFGEPLPLLALELAFWAIIALAEAFVIASVMEWTLIRRG